MRKLSLLLILVVGCVAIATAQFNQLPLDYNIMGGGARAHGMGGAFIGIADDATATSWNPAGIAQLEKFEASAVGNFSFKKFSFETDVNDPTFPANTEHSTYSSNSNHLAPNFFSFAVPVKISSGSRNLVFALSYQRLVDFGYNQKEDSATFTWDYKVRGGIDAISPAVAVQLLPNVMIGAAGNIIVNGLTHTSVTTSKITSVVDNIERKYKSSGFDINAGALIQVNKMLNIGATVRLPFTLTDKYTYHHDRTGFTAFDTTYPDQKTTYPLMFGIGVAFKPTDNLTLAADFEHRNYSSSEFTYKHHNIYGQVVDTTTSMDWRDVNQFRVGLEYVIISQNTVFPVRLGFRTNPLVGKNKIISDYNRTTLTYTSSDTTGNTELVFTGGFGVKMGNVWLDLAYEYGVGDFYKDETTVSDGATYNYYIKENSNNIIASCIVHF